MTKSTKQVAGELGVKVTTLNQAVWQCRIDEPERGPGGCFQWQDENIAQAAHVMGKKVPEGVLSSIQRRLEFQSQQLNRNVNHILKGAKNAG